MNRSTHWITHCFAQCFRKSTLNVRRGTYNKMTHVPRKYFNEKEVISEFEKRRRKLTRLALVIGIVIGAVILVRYQLGIPKEMTAILLAVSFVWAFIVHFKLWRCPSCDGHLGRVYLGLKLPKFCPHCGIRLIKE